MATRFKDGTLVFESKEEGREWERGINLKAGTIAAIFTLIVGVLGLIALACWSSPPPLP